MYCCCCCCSVHILRLFQTLITPSILHQILTSRPFLELAGSCASNGTNSFWKIYLKGVQKWIFPRLLKCKNQEIWMVQTKVSNTQWEHCQVSHSSHSDRAPCTQPVSRTEAQPCQGPSGPGRAGPQDQCVAEGHHQPSAGARSRQPEAAVPSSFSILEAALYFLLYESVSYFSL